MKNRNLLTTILQLIEDQEQTKRVTKRKGKKRPFYTPFIDYITFLTNDVSSDCGNDDHVGNGRADIRVVSQNKKRTWGHHAISTIHNNK